MSFVSVLLAHLARYPAMELADLYKLVHQAALGSGHVVSDPEAARAWLRRELAALGEGPDEPLLDLLSEETGILRVHLRPYQASGGDPERLLQAFLRTVNEYNGYTQTIERYWKTAASLGRFLPTEMEAFLETMRARGYPAVHHSPAYERLYRPAYRVVWQGFW